MTKQQRVPHDPPPHDPPPHDPLDEPYARDPQALGRLICLRLLTVSPCTQAQLAAEMHRRGVPEEVANSVLASLIEAGLVGDGAFAKAWVESRHHSRGLSRRSLAAELRQRGVDDGDITEAVEALGPEEEVATARHLAERKLAATRGQPPDVRARRTAALLARKGYSAGLAYRLIRECLEQEGAGSADAILPALALAEDLEP